MHSASVHGPLNIRLKSPFNSHLTFVFLKQSGVKGTVQGSFWGGGGGGGGRIP